jgi:hypothetical protein
MSVLTFSQYLVLVVVIGEVLGKENIFLSMSGKESILLWPSKFGCPAPSPTPSVKGKMVNMQQRMKIV